MKRLHDIVLTLLYIYIACIPILFLPVTQDYYDTAKWYALTVSALGAGILWIIHYLKSSRASHISLSPVTTGLLLITVSGFLSTIISSTNRVESLLGPFGPITFLNLSMLSLFIPSFLTHSSRGILRWSLFSAISILGLISIYQFFGLGKVMLPGVKFLSDSLWTPTGSAVATATIYLMLLPLIFAEAIASIKEKKETATAFIVIMTVVTVTALGISLWQLVPKLSATLLPHQYGWAITLEILKNIKHAFFGIGAENFMTAFSIGRPATYNLSSFWAVRFTANSNFLFHITTIYGLVGLAATIVLLKGMFNKSTQTLYTVARIIGILVLLLTPPTLPVILCILLVMIMTEPVDNKLYPVKSIHSVWLKSGIGIISCALVGFAVYAVVRTFSAEKIFYTSLLSAQANNGTNTYNQQVMAIEINPYVSRFHIIYSQTNLALATSLANSLSQADSKATADQKKKDRDLVAQLIQQAIKEAKTAVALNKSNILAWENMARIYQQLIDIAQGSDAWADASFKQAIALDPINPVLRLELGSITMRVKNYKDAITHFQKSAALKPDYANAYYNLAYAYQASGDTESAIRALEQTQKLIPNSSADYEKVTSEITSLKSNLEKTGAQTNTTPMLSLTPTPPPRPVISPPISLPPDSGPGGLR